LRKYSIEPHVIICYEVLLSIPQLREKLSHHEVLLSTSSMETNYHTRFYWVLPQLRDTLSHEVLLSTSSTERQVLNRISCDNLTQLRNYSIEPHVIICLSVEELLIEKLSHEVLLSTSSTERQIITSWGSMSNSSTERQIITWGSIE
jgi:hypothetical protein